MMADGKFGIERALTQEDFDRFASLSGDGNPIHTDPAFAARTRFGRPVAHGLLLVSVIRGLIERLLPGGHLADEQVMFPAPTFAGERMRFAAEITGRGPDGSEVHYEVLRVADDVVTCRGEARVRP